MGNYIVNHFSTVDEIHNARTGIARARGIEVRMKDIDPTLFEDEAEARRLFESLKMDKPSEYFDITYEPEYIAQYYKVMGELDFDRLPFDISEDHPEINNDTITDVEFNEIKDLYNGGYQKKGLYSYEDMRGRFLTIRYNTPDGKNQALTLQAKEDIFGMEYEYAGNLSQIKYKRLSQDRDNGYNVILDAADLYMSRNPGLTEPQKVYQIMNTLVQSAYKERPYFKDVDHDTAVTSLVASFEMFERGLRKNIMTEVNAVNTYFRKQEQYKEGSSLYEKLAGIKQSKKELDKAVKNLTKSNGEGIIDTYKATTANICEFIIDIIQDETMQMLKNPDVYSKVPCVDAMSTETRRALVDIIRKDENPQKTTQLIQAVYSTDKKIPAAMAEAIKEGIKEAAAKNPLSTLRVYHLDTRIIDVLKSINSKKFLTPQEKQEEQKKYTLQSFTKGTNYFADRKEYDNAKNQNEIRSVSTKYVDIETFIYRHSDPNTADWISRTSYIMDSVCDLFTENKDNPNINEKMEVLFSYAPKREDGPDYISKVNRDRFESVFGLIAEDIYNFRSLEYIENRDYPKMLDNLINGIEEIEETKDLKNPLEEIKKGQQKSRENSGDHDEHLNYRPFENLGY